MFMNGRGDGTGCTLSMFAADTELGGVAGGCAAVPRDLGSVL